MDYTADVLAFANAINRFPARSVERGDIVQALHEIARDQRSREGRRALVAVAVETAQVSSITAEAVLEQLTATRSVLYAATLADLETSTVPSGSTSGGLHVSSQRTAGLWDALERISSELHRQYVGSYESDPKSDGSVAIESARSGIAVRGPTRVR